MKTCPACHNTYEDESMMFCLVDGARLLKPTTAADPNATQVLPPPRVTEPGPTVAARQPTVAAAQPTLRAEPELMQIGPRSYSSDSPERGRSHALPWLLAIVIVLGVSGIVIALILTRNRSEPSQQVSQASTPATSPPRSDASPTPRSESSPESTPPPTSTPTPLPRSSPQPTPVKPKPAFGPLMDNTTFNGTNLTYYPRTSPGLCEADCARTPACRGFTWIKPGGYNPGDSAMCYLISYVSGKVTHKCCMSAVKN